MWLCKLQTVRPEFEVKIKTTRKNPITQVTAKSSRSFRCRFKSYSVILTVISVTALNR